uniref:Uncharacterized protein n=1 Tax=Amphimedon queenslandica TaxID=400682 RepID=A0A1X7UCK7_AMPQE
MCVNTGAHTIIALITLQVATVSVNSTVWYTIVILIL